MQFGLSDHDIDLIKAALDTYPQITSAKIFGSRAKGNFKPNSDVDIALFGNIDHSLLAHIKTHLDDLPMPYMFDVVIYNKINHQPFTEHIDKYGIEIATIS